MTSSKFNDFNGLVNNIFVDLINTALPVIGGLALLVFIWGLAKFIFKVGDDEKKTVEDGKNLMKWGLIALFILVSFRAILLFFYSDLGFTRSFGFPYLREF